MSTVPEWLRGPEHHDACEVPPLLLPDPFVSQGALTGHTDAVRELAMHPSMGLLLSCSADGTCRLWNRQQQSSPEVGCVPFVEGELCVCKAEGEGRG